MWHRPGRMHFAPTNARTPSECGIDLGACNAPLQMPGRPRIVESTWAHAMRPYKNGTQILILIGGDRFKAILKTISNAGLPQHDVNITGRCF